MSSDTPSPSTASEGIAIQVFGEANRGGRKHMEDVIGVELQTKGRGQAFVAVFDGHGGKEAAQFADKELWSNISTMDGFNSSDSEAVKKAIHQGFQNTHDKMWSVRPSWKNSKAGTLSTSGTTASVVIIRQDRMFVANVGDSTIVLGSDPNFIEDSVVDRGTTSSFIEERGEIKAVVLTDDHKPESDRETKRIERIGGQVLRSSKGVMRVAWLRKRLSPSHTRLNPNAYDVVPFLSVARSLGDLWSYSEHCNDYFVSPVPDVTQYKLDIRRDKFVVLASDGLWNVMTPQEVTEFVHTFRQKEMTDNPHVKSSKVAHALIDEALKKWGKKCWNADNISIMVVFFRGLTKTSSSGEEDSSSSSIRSDRVPSIDSGLRSGSESPSSKGDEDTDLSGPSNWRTLKSRTEYGSARGTGKGLIGLDIDITSTECVETSALLMPSIDYDVEDMIDDVEIVPAADDDSSRPRANLVASSESSSSLDPAVSPPSVPCLDPVSYCSPGDGSGCTGDDGEVTTLGKRSVAMCHGHSSPIAVPCISKRSRSVDEYPLDLSV